LSKSDATKPGAVRAPRADARKNRERLLYAALVLFSESRGEVTLSAVAEKAGVGIGTLYRHFPTRDALVEAVYRSEVERLGDDAPKLLKKLAPEAALEEWLKRYAALIVAKRGLKDALQSIFEPGSEASTFSRDHLTAAITLLLEAAAKAHSIRDDADAEDVLLTVAASTWAFAGDKDGKDWKDRTRRVLGLVMDGLRYRGR
jgi:AcrR family transcriptional regulator